MDDLHKATVAVLHATWGEGAFAWSAHAKHNYNAECAVCRGDVAAIIEVAAPILLAERDDLSEDLHSAARCGTDKPCPGCEIERLKAELKYAKLQRDWLAAEAPDEIRARFFRLVAEDKAKGNAPGHERPAPAPADGGAR